MKYTCSYCSLAPTNHPLPCTLIDICSSSGWSSPHWSPLLIATQSLTNVKRARKCRSAVRTRIAAANAVSRHVHFHTHFPPRPRNNIAPNDSNAHAGDSQLLLLLAISSPAPGHSCTLCGAPSKIVKCANAHTRIELPRAVRDFAPR